MPGRHLTDQQMRLYMKFRKNDSAAVAASKASISVATAYRIENGSVTVLDRPGLGVDLDLKAIEALTLRRDVVS